MNGSPREAEIEGRASRRTWICCWSAFAVALALAVAYASTRSPWWDEGLFSDVAINFRNGAHLRSSLLAPHSYVNLPAPDRFTYWQFPAYLVGLGAWLRVLPVTIYSVRLFSIAWGCVFVASWFFLVRAFSRNETLALLAAVIVAFDYSVIAAASDGRMDMMCAGLGAAALAFYASWRDTHRMRAAVLTGLCGAACLFSHPMGFVMNACLLALVLLDIRRLDWRFFAGAAAFYIVFGIACLLYVLQDPALFFAQMKAISGYRVGGASFTLASMARDLPDRYLHFYFAPHGGAHRLKIFIPLFGVIGLAMLLFDRRMRAHALVRRLVVMLLVAFLGVAAIDYMKFPYYLVYVMPVLGVVGAVWLYECFRARSPVRFAAAGLALAFLGANAANCLYYIRRDDFRNQYRPAVAEIERLREPGEVIMGPSELGYSLGFGPPLMDDCYLGYSSGIRPRMVVTYTSGGVPPGDPKPWYWSEAQLAANYHAVYSNPGYTIYVRKTNTGS